MKYHEVKRRLLRHGNGLVALTRCNRESLEGAKIDLMMGVGAIDERGLLKHPPRIRVRGEQVWARQQFTPHD